MDNTEINIEKYKEQKGITLIYVVLIIIMLIICLLISSIIIKSQKEESANKVVEFLPNNFVEEVKDDNVISENVENNIIASNIDNKEKNEIYIPDGLTKTVVEGWSNEITAVTDGTYIIPIPKDYRISDRKDENNIKDGLVIIDKNENEFIWIPVSEKLLTEFKEDGNYLEPRELNTTDFYNNNSLNLDSQECLDYYYGQGYYKYKEDFKYTEHYIEMINSVNKYGGFFIGRYETTIDSLGNIGSKVDTETLRFSSILKDGINNKSNENYYYRWWGLYNSQRNSNVTGNGNYVQTNMLWGQQWNKILEHMKKNNIDYSGNAVDNHYTEKKLQRSGVSQYNYNGKVIYDKIYNMYDFRRNAYEAIGMSVSEVYRMFVGSSYEYNYPYGNYRNGIYALGTEDTIGSRMTLYIK